MGETYNNAKKLQKEQSLTEASISQSAITAQLLFMMEFLSTVSKNMAVLLIHFFITLFMFFGRLY